MYRDHSGQVIVALSQKIVLPRTVEMAEVLAARRAVEFARELSLFDVIIKGDCLQVVKALNAFGGCNTFPQTQKKQNRRKKIIKSDQIVAVRRLGLKAKACEAKAIGAVRLAGG
ncbi:hypothetical protein CFP56_004884 [Quercus suber]|uniref:RNase H type-1 domain-containing protein n=1 Tax=Quercus suber TaxID=58331 RepID=A0AAW0LBZ7_QUESU